MPHKTPGYDPFESARRDEERRHGREHDDRYEAELELAAADRLTEQASLPPGDPEARTLARHLLGRGPSPCEDARGLSTGALSAGEAVRCHTPDETRRGHVVRELDDGLVLVDFASQGASVVDAAMLEREAA